MQNEDVVAGGAIVLQSATLKSTHAKNVDLHAQAHHGPQLDSFPVANRRSQPSPTSPCIPHFANQGLIYLGQILSTGSFVSLTPPRLSTVASIHASRLLHGMFLHRVASTAACNIFVHEKHISTQEYATSAHFCADYVFVQ